MSSGRRFLLPSRTLCAALVLAAATAGAGARALFGADENPPIALNSIGYLPTAIKIANVPDPVDEFVVRDVQTGGEVLRGRSKAVDLPSGETEGKIVDFTPLETEGLYQIVTTGVDGKSAQFRVSNDVFNWPFFCAMKA